MNKISHPLTFSYGMCRPGGSCESDDFQLWTEDVESNGTAGIQDILEGQTRAGFSG